MTNSESYLNIAGNAALQAQPHLDANTKAVAGEYYTFVQIPDVSAFLDSNNGGGSQGKHS